jgi:copper(I)-binding protein
MRLAAMTIGEERGMRSMTKSSVLTLVFLVALALAIDPAQADQDKPLTASDGWVKLPAPGETATMAFATVENPTMYAVYLKSASADVAGRVELRETNPNGESSNTAAEFLTVPAYDSLYMGPKGAHLMLLDLKRPLSEGDTVRLTLTTEIGSTIEVLAIVKNQ